LRLLPLKDPGVASASCLTAQARKHPSRKISEIESPSIARDINNVPHVNLLHMELFHHFNTVTAETLIFGEEIWRKEVIPLSFQVLHIYQIHDRH
jgi:hypothetical protein